MLYGSLAVIACVIASIVFFASQTKVSTYAGFWVIGSSAGICFALVWKMIKVLPGP